MAVKVRDLQEILSKQFVYWWIDKQNSIGTGEFGGGLNDDVELTNGWNVLYLTAHDKKIGKALKWEVESVQGGSTQGSMRY